MKPTQPLVMRLRTNASLVSSGGVAYLLLVRSMSRAHRIALVALDGALILLMLFYGLLILLVVLRPWLGDMRGLLLGHYPPDLMVFCAGIACLIGVLVVFRYRRAAGVVWLCAMVLLVVSALLRQFSRDNVYFESRTRLWFYAGVSLAAVVIFVRFIYSSSHDHVKT